MQTWSDFYGYLETGPKWLSLSGKILRKLNLTEENYRKSCIYGNPHRYLNWVSEGVSISIGPVCVGSIMAHAGSLCSAVAGVQKRPNSGRPGQQRVF